MKKVFLSALMALSISLGIRAQELPNIVPPSPSVANLMRFEEVPLDQYSGQPNIGIPIFTKKIDQGLDFNVSLNYNTSGIRVDERSGWTGTGWSLFSGGTISRTIIGCADEKKITLLGSDSATKGKVGTFHNGYYDRITYRETTRSSSGIINSEEELWQEFVWKTSSGRELYDYQPDMFQFNFMGYSGRFYIVNDQGVLKPIIVSASEKIKIELNYDTDFIISSFTVTSPNGYKFLFADVEKTLTEYKVTSIDQLGIKHYLYESESGNAMGEEAAVYRNSAWHISKISNSHNTVLVDFDYHNVNVRYDSPKTSEYNYIKNPTLINGVYFDKLENPLGWGYNLSLLPSKSSWNWTTNSTSTKKVKEIVFRDGSKLNFDITLNHPEQDNSTGCILDKIKVLLPNGTLNKEYEFNYYTSQKNRLFLDEIFEKAGNKSYKHILSYNGWDELPGYGSENKDRWGYYNGNYNTDDNADIYKSHADTVNVIKGALKSIQYPLGGIKNFIFESNRFSFLGNTLVDPKMIPQNFRYSNVISNNKVLRHHPTNSSNNNYEIIKIANRAKAYLTIQNLTGSTEGINNHFMELIPAIPKTSGTSLGGLLVAFSRDINDYNLDTAKKTTINNLTDNYHELDLTEGFYVVRLNSINYIPQYLPYEVSLIPSLYYNKFIENQKFMFGGGIRIKEITFTDNLREAMKVNYSYKLSDEGIFSRFNLNSESENYSSGSFDGSLNKNRKHSKTFNYIFKVQTSTNCQSSLPIDVDIDVTVSNSPLITSMTKGSYVGYKNVVVVKADNGKLSSSYSSPIDYPSYAANFYTNPDPFNLDIPAIDIDYKRGNLLESTVFDNNGKILKVTKNEYDYKLLESNMYLFKHYSKNCGYNARYLTYDAFKTGARNADLTPPCPQSFIDPGERRCGLPSDFILMQPMYHDYGLPFLSQTILRESFYDSLGNRVDNESIVKFNYSLHNYKLTREQKNSSEGETLVKLVKYAHDVNNTRLINEYRITEPLETKTYKGNSLLSHQKTIYSTNHNSSNLYLPEVIQTAKGNEPLEDRIVYHSYNTKGNPTELSKADGTHIVYIWGYQNTQPIAKIENATLADIPSSIKEEIISNSNLDIDSSSETTLKNSLNKLRNISLVPNLSNAQITTYTYDPLIGVTSITYPRGRTVYYQYDSFNRLSLVKDDQNNILKENIYHYKNQ